MECQHGLDSGFVVQPGGRTLQRGRCQQQDTEGTETKGEGEEAWVRRNDKLTSAGGQTGRPGPHGRGASIENAMECYEMCDGAEAGRGAPASLRAQTARPTARGPALP